MAASAIPRPGGDGGMAMAWMWLILGGCFEVGFTTCLRFVDGFRNFGWTAGFLASVGTSMALLEVASRTIPMGTAYAVWGGIGALGTVIVGIVWFGEPANALRLALIVALVGCIAGLKLAGGAH
ncbi:DMT family transporter [Sphingomonas profundi]|uniref:DMT family transporter n=1 Tax=Alterirhizorhabdus profundi TaxID=2681549 RepID=UPI001E633571|nr:multidrug efflux SMR transporter [Sphingomonas profundi]